MIELNKISVLLLLIFIFSSGLIILIYQLLYNFIIPSVENRKFKSFLERWTFRSQLLVWLVFTLYFLYRFLLESPFYTLIVVPIIIILGWYSWRDLISGLIFKIENKIKPGDTIESNGFKGKLISIGNRNIVIETSKNKQQVLFHRLIMDKGYSIIKEKDRDKVLEIVLNKEVVTKFGGNDELLKMAMASPWASKSHNPEIISLDDSTIKIKVWAIDSADKINYKNYILSELA